MNSITIKSIAKLLQPLQFQLKKLGKDLSEVKSDIKVVKAHNVRIELNQIDMEEKFEKNLTQWKNELFTRIDTILGRLTKAEEEKIITKAKEPLEKRVKYIEDKFAIISSNST